jgi:hypothetical protein
MGFAIFRAPRRICGRMREEVTGGWKAFLMRNFRTCFSTKNEGEQTLKYGF